MPPERDEISGRSFQLLANLFPGQGRGAGSDWELRRFARDRVIRGLRETAIHLREFLGRILQRFDDMRIRSVLGNLGSCPPGAVRRVAHVEKDSLDFAVWSSFVAPARLCRLLDVIGRLPRNMGT